MPRPFFKKIDKVWLFFAPVFAVLLSLDQLSKEWALEQLDPVNRVNFGFALSRNEGMVFGLPLPLPVIYVVTLAILGLGVYLVVKEKLWRDHWHLTGIALILAGAIGNLIDRARLGYVVDFIKVYWWPTFNLADVWIVLGVMIFSWIFLVREDVIEKL